MSKDRAHESGAMCGNMIPTLTINNLNLRIKTESVTTTVQ